MYSIQNKTEDMLYIISLQWISTWKMDFTNSSGIQVECKICTLAVD